MAYNAQANLNNDKIHFNREQRVPCRTQLALIWMVGTPFGVLYLKIGVIQIGTA